MENCWINPDGEVIEVPFAGHNDYAFRLLINEAGSRELYYEFMDRMEDEQGIDSPYEVLHRRGWVRVTDKAIMGISIDLTKPMRNTIDPPMNAKQMRVAKALCEEMGISFHEAINDKRFW